MQPLEISLLELFFNLIFQLPDDFKTSCKEVALAPYPKYERGILV